MKQDTKRKIEKLIFHLPRDAYFGRSMLAFLKTLPPVEREEAFVYACILCPFWKGCTVGLRRVGCNEPIDEVNEKGARLFQLLDRILPLQREEDRAAALWRMVKRDSIEVLEERVEISTELREAVIRCALLAPDFPGYSYSPQSILEDPPVSQEELFNGIGEKKLQFKAIIERSPAHELFMLLFAETLIKLPDRKEKACALCYAALKIRQDGPRELHFRDCSFQTILNQEKQTAAMEMHGKVYAKIEGISYALGEQPLFYAAYRMLEVFEEERSLDVLANMLSNLIRIDRGEY